MHVAQHNFFITPKCTVPCLQWQQWTFVTQRHPVRKTTAAIAVDRRACDGLCSMLWSGGLGCIATTQLPSSSSPASSH